MTITNFAIANSATRISGDATANHGQWITPDSLKAKKTIKRIQSVGFIMIYRFAASPAVTPLFISQAVAR
jgi:hypothetical protein